MLSEIIEALSMVREEFGEIPVVVETGEDLISIENIEIACTDKEKYVIVIKPYSFEDAE